MAINTAVKNTALDVSAIRKDFSIFKRIYQGNPVAYLDNAATTQKPQQVINALCHFYQNSNANVKRGVHFLGEEATLKYEQARKRVAGFINARRSYEVVFTRNTTEGINLVAYAYARAHLKKGDEILLTKMEHHSNIVPWLMLADGKNIKIKYIDVDEEGRLVLEELDQLLNHKTKLVSITSVSNTLGTINPVKHIIHAAHQVNAKVIVDAAQAAAHLKIDVQDLDCDFLAFSGHKMLGPTGIGVLYIKEELEYQCPPFLGGGEMIQEVFLDHYIPAAPPEKFEAGTPHIAGAIGLHTAIDYLESIPYEQRATHEHELTNHLLLKLQTLPFVSIIGPKNTHDRIGNVSFLVDGVHPHDLSDLLNNQAVCTRSGHHCTQPLMERFGIIATTRASLYFYNTKEEIDRLIQGIEEAYKLFVSE